LRKQKFKTIEEKKRAGFTPSATGRQNGREGPLIKGGIGKALFRVNLKKKVRRFVNGQFEEGEDGGGAKGMSCTYWANGGGRVGAVGLSGG